MVNYYHRFLPNLSTTLTPLHHLLKKHIKWAWSPECEAAFNKVKQLMASDTVLTHSNPGLPLVLSCDASPYGLGAVLSHTMPDGGGTTCGIRVKNPDTGGMQLCPNRQGGIGCYLGSEEIPPVFVWVAFHTDHRQRQQLHACRDRHFSCWHTPIPSGIGVIISTPMQMPCPDCQVDNRTKHQVMMRRIVLCTWYSR